MADLRRTKIPILLHFRMELDIWDDPHGFCRRIFCCHDVSETRDYRTHLEDSAAAAHLWAAAPGAAAKWACYSVTDRKPSAKVRGVSQLIIWREFENQGGRPIGEAKSESARPGGIVQHCESRTMGGLVAHLGNLDSGNRIAAGYQLALVFGLGQLQTVCRRS